MSARALLVAFTLSLGAVIPPTGAQQSDRAPVVGFIALAAGKDEPIVEAWREGMRELGYVEGRTIKTEFRTAQGHADQLSGPANGLIQLKGLT